MEHKMDKVNVFIYDKLVDYDTIKSIIDIGHIYQASVAFTEGALFKCYQRSNYYSIASDAVAIHPKFLKRCRDRIMYGICIETEKKYLNKLDGYYGCSQSWYGKALSFDPTYRTNVQVQCIRFENLYEFERKMYDLVDVKNAICYFGNIENSDVQQIIATQYGDSKKKYGEAHLKLKEIQKWKGKMKNVMG